MDKKIAQNLIEKTFNDSFSEERFTIFAKNLLNDIEPKNNFYTGNLIWDDYKEHINTYKRIGKYIDPKGDALDVLIVEVKSVTKLERARTVLRNFVIKHLSKFEKDYALVAFYSKEDEGADWRFSFIKLEYRSELDEAKGKVKTQKEFTPAKRYSFLVGKYEKAHTAKNQLLPLLQNIANNPTIEELEAAFSIEKVTDEFFSQYKDLYVKLYEHFQKDTHVKTAIDKAGIDTTRFTKKLLGQIVFLYFLQKKGWLGVAQNKHWGSGNKRFVQDLYKQAQAQGLNFFKDKLQYLFYEALAKERDKVNSYYEPFNCRIPFLNGGLFEADYDWQNANITIPSSLFRSEEKNKSGDVGTGVLDVFDRYNFTIKEDEPLDKEVAVDPEMLGKVFENMLDITERKSKGAFYTPREIVHYMCQESLIHYLDNALNSETSSYQALDSNQLRLLPGSADKKGNLKLEIEHGDNLRVPKKDIEDFIRNGHSYLENDINAIKKLDKVKDGEQKSTNAAIILPESIRIHADLIDKKLSDIRICDPAIGSGAFPVGLLHELVNAMLVLKPHLGYEYMTKKLINFGFEENGRTLSIAEVSESRYIYRLKRHIIQESIYGVDIDASAIDIARLRLWLSLVVDEEDLDSIETLPNLDYKIVCGNSLISRYSLEIPLNDVFKDVNKKIRNKDFENLKIKELIGNEEVNVKFYKKIVNDFLVESSHNKKDAFRALIKEIKNAFKNALNQQEKDAIATARGEVDNLVAFDIFGKQIGSKEAIAKAKEKLQKLEDDKIKTLEGDFYKNSIEWRFEFPNLLNDNGDFMGFDVVIGNPPYVQLQDKEKINPNLLRLYEFQNFETFIKSGDIYSLFYEKGLMLSRPSWGVLSFITSNRFCFTNYGESTRKYLSKHNIKSIINLNKIDVFKEANVGTIITTVENRGRTGQKLRAGEFNSYNINSSFIEQIFKQTDLIESSFYDSGQWGFYDSSILNLRKKIINKGTPLSKIKDLSINRGITTGLNKVFLIPVKNAHSEFKQNKSFEILKPVFKGAEIKRWKCKEVRNYIFHTYTGVIIEEYPEILHYLSQYKNDLQNVYEAKNGQKKWYELRKCSYYDSFQQRKIIWTRLSNINSFAISENGEYSIDSTSFATGSNLEYYCSVLNSRIVYFYFKLGGVIWGKDGIKWFGDYFDRIPVLLPNTETNNIFGVKYSYLKTLADKQAFEIHFNFFEEVVDGIVFELYFPEEIKSAGKEILKHLGDLKPITDEMSEEEKLAIIQSEFERLYDPNHPVRFAIETLDSVEEVRIIKEALK